MCRDAHREMSRVKCWSVSIVSGVMPRNPFISSLGLAKGHMIDIAQLEYHRILWND